MIDKDVVASTDVEQIFNKIDALQEIAIAIRDKALPLNRGTDAKTKEEATPEHPDTGQIIIDRLAGVHSILMDAKYALERFV